MIKKLSLHKTIFSSIFTTSACEVYVTEVWSASWTIQLSWIMPVKFPVVGCCIAPNFYSLKNFDFRELFLDLKLLSNAWLVDEEVSMLGTNNSQGLRKFTFKAKWHESRKFQTTEIWSYISSPETIFCTRSASLNFVKLVSFSMIEKSSVFHSFSTAKTIKRSEYSRVSLL